MPPRSHWNDHQRNGNRHENEGAIAERGISAESGFARRSLGDGSGVPRLRRADCSTPGIRRLRRGRGFTYLDEQTGGRIDDEETLARIASLVIPPAWTGV
jgi:hypothetical protein